MTKTTLPQELTEISGLSVPATIDDIFATPISNYERDSFHPLNEKKNAYMISIGADRLPLLFARMNLFLAAGLNFREIHSTTINQLNKAGWECRYDFAITFTHKTRIDDTSVVCIVSATSPDGITLSAETTTDVELSDADYDTLYDVVANHEQRETT